MAQFLGADTALTLVDLYYVKALIDSFMLDYNTVKAAGKITDVQQGLIIDKYNLIADAVGKLKDLDATAQQIDAGKGIYSYITSNCAGIPALADEIGSMSFTIDPNATVTQYIPKMPFVSPPIYKGGVLEPDAATMTNIAVPIQSMKMMAHTGARDGGVSVDVTGKFTKGGGQVDVFAAEQAASSGKLPIGVLAAAGVVAFLLLNK